MRGEHTEDGDQPIGGPDMRDRFRGCLLGGAAGDALGAPVEFLSLAQIRTKFGPAGIREFSPAYGRLGAITDDTQMTLFTAEGMIRSYMRSCDRGICSPGAVVGHAYGRWLLTQGEVPRNQPFGLKDWPGWLIGEAGLHSRRAPGNTCISALRDKESQEDPVRNSSKGCGAVMRMAPVGLAGCRFGWSADYVMSLGSSLGHLTHGHPTGYLSAGAFAVIIFALVSGESLAKAVEIAIEQLERLDGHQETVAALNGALKAADVDEGEFGVPPTLGEGWIGEEALAIGVYCALVAPNLEEGIILAVNIDGDADSTGSIAGNLLGAMYGPAGIPKRWLQQLELEKVISQVADDLYDCVEWNSSGSMDREVSAAFKRQYKRYPPN